MNVFVLIILLVIPPLVAIYYFFRGVFIQFSFLEYLSRSDSELGKKVKMKFIFPGIAYPSSNGFAPAFNIFFESKNDDATSLKFKREYKRYMMAGVILIFLSVSMFLFGPLIASLF